MCTIFLHCVYSEFTETSGAVGICLSHGNLAGKAVSLDYVDAFERAVGFGHVASCKVIDAKVSRAVGSLTVKKAKTAKIIGL